MMLRECVRLAYEDKRVCVFLEPIALYRVKDLTRKGDNQWAAPYDVSQQIACGEIGVQGDGPLTMISYATQ